MCVAQLWADGSNVWILMTYHFTAAGAAYGTAKSGIGISGVGTFRPDLIMKVGWTPESSTGPRGASLTMAILVPHSRRHVRYHRSLRSCYCSPDRRSSPTVKEYEFVHVCFGVDRVGSRGLMNRIQFLHAPCGWIVSGSLRCGCWLHYWHCR